MNVTKERNVISYAMNTFPFFNLSTCLATPYRVQSLLRDRTELRRGLARASVAGRVHGRTEGKLAFKLSGYAKMYAQKYFQQSL